MTSLDRLAFTLNPIDTISEKRTEDSIALALDDPSAHFLLINNGQVILKSSGSVYAPRLSTSEIDAIGLQTDAAILLGMTSEGPLLALPFDDTNVQLPQNMILVGLRDTFAKSLLSVEEQGMIAQAAALVSWHQSHKYCGRCGGETAIRSGGYRRVCKKCASEHFPRTDPVVIMLTVRGDSCLLGRSPRFAPGMYSCLAGFVEPGETIEAAVARETFEESGIRITDVTYHSSQPWPFPYSLMIGCLAEAVTEDIDFDSAELEDCRWFPRQEIRQLLDDTHPLGLRAPQQGTIARYLIEHWVNRK